MTLLNVMEKSEINTYITSQIQRPRQISARGREKCSSGWPPSLPVRKKYLAPLTKARSAAEASSTSLNRLAAAAK